MVVNFYPTMSHDWVQQILSGFAGSVHQPEVNPNLKDFGFHSDSIKFSGQYHEIILGNLTLLSMECHAEEAIVLKNAPLPVTDIYTFQLKYVDNYNPDYGTSPSYQKSAGMFASISASFSIEIEPRHRFRSLFISISRAYLLDIIKEFEFDTESKWAVIFKTSQNVRYPFVLQLKDYFLLDLFFEEGSNLNNLELAANVKTIIVLFLDRLLNSPPINQEHIDIREFNLIKGIIQTIQNDFTTKYRLEELAKICKMSNARFSNLIQRITGKTFVSFYTQIRMEKALNLLNQNAVDSVGQLATLLGYKNIQEFSKAFVRYYGYTPYSLWKFRSQ